MRAIPRQFPMRLEQGNAEGLQGNTGKSCEQLERIPSQPEIPGRHCMRGSRQWEQTGRVPSPRAIGGPGHGTATEGRVISPVIWSADGQPLGGPRPLTRRNRETAASLVGADPRRFAGFDRGSSRKTQMMIINVAAIALATLATCGHARANVVLLFRHNGRAWDSDRARAFVVNHYRRG
jgi:hypothetical protein